MTRSQFDVTPFLRQDEGQHFDRKSMWEGPEGAKRARDRRAVRDQVAEYVAAFANAEGGILILGIEDDHTLSGHGLPAKARQGAGLAALSDEEYLLKRKLADRRGNNVQLRRAAELLFARSGPDHPNAGVRVFRVIGSERRTGPEHNVEERPRIEGNLPAVIDEAAAVVGSLLRRPSRLVGTRFRAVPEYPEFSWKEALLNAIAHRDYAVEGAGAEIWLFEDRMEVISPGGLLGDLTLDEVLSLRRVHRSRNPRLVRVLVDIGVARDQGEGIPRMFAEMEDAFLPRPEIEVSPRNVSVTLRNTPTLTSADREFVARLGSTEVSNEEFRALLHAHRQGRVENAAMRSIAGLDTLESSILLRRLRGRNLLELHPHGAQSYYTLPPVLQAHTELAVFLPDPPGEAVDRGELAADRGEPGTDRGEPGTDRGEPSADRGEPGTDRGELPPEIMQAIAELGTRPRKEKVRAVIKALCSVREWSSPSELAKLLDFKPAKLTERHLSPMVEAGQLERRYPDNLSHLDQAYRTIRRQDELRFTTGDPQ